MDNAAWPHSHTPRPRVLPQGRACCCIVGSCFFAMLCSMQGEGAMRQVKDALLDDTYTITGTFRPASANIPTHSAFLSGLQLASTYEFAVQTHTLTENGPMSETVRKLILQISFLFTLARFEPRSR